MSQPVVIKSNKSGLCLMLDSEIPFVDLLEAIGQKFRESEKFFKNAQFAITFEGRNLSTHEESRIVDVITKNSTIKIMCIIDMDDDREATIREKIDTYYRSIMGNDPKIYHGDVLEGKTLESGEDIVLLGDVCPGGRIVSTGSITILGGLYGTASAGLGGDENAYIIALDMNPEMLKIGSVSWQVETEEEKKPKKGLFKKKEKKVVKGTESADPILVTVRDGEFFYEPAVRANIVKVW